VQIAPGVVAREVNAQEELDRSWSEIQRWLRALLRDGADERRVNLGAGQRVARGLERHGHDIFVQPRH
jgi:hypothetical protein